MRFQAKLAKSRNMHIRPIKTTASIPTAFCTVIKTTKSPSWVVSTHALQIQDGGRPPSWKNRKKSPYPGRGSTDFDEIWLGDAVRRSTVLTVPTVENSILQYGNKTANINVKNCSL